MFGYSKRMQCLEAVITVLKKKKTTNILSSSYKGKLMDLIALLDIKLQCIPVMY